MKQQKILRSTEALDVEADRELTENELATICGGSSSFPLRGLSTGNSYSFPDLTNFLSPQNIASNTTGQTAGKAGAHKSSSVPGLPDLGSLSNLTNGLLGALM